MALVPVQTSQNVSGLTKDSEPVRQDPAELTAFVTSVSHRRQHFKTATHDQRLICAVVELRESVWSDILHIASCWKVTPQDLIDASRRSQ